MTIDQARKEYRRKMHLKIVFALVLAAIAYVYSNYQQEKESIASQGWPYTTGEITSSEVGLTSNTTSKIVTYEHKIMYSYNIDGQMYYNNKIKQHGSVSSIYREEIEEHVQALPIGSKVKVFYQPGNVNNAYLAQ